MTSETPDVEEVIERMRDEIEQPSYGAALHAYSRLIVDVLPPALALLEQHKALEKQIQGAAQKAVTNLWERETLKAELSALREQVEYWKEEAGRYAANADYWRERFSPDFTCLPLPEPPDDNCPSHGEAAQEEA